MKKIPLLCLLYIPLAFSQPEPINRNLQGLQTIEDRTDIPTLDIGELTYQVPLENIGQYSYVNYVFLEQGGILSSGGHPDENGLIRERVVVPLFDLKAFPKLEQLSHYLMGYNRYDGSRFYSMHITGLKLHALISSIGINLREISDNRIKPSIEYEHESAKEIEVNLNDEYLSPADVYELVRVQTGCLIDEIGKRVLIISNCS